MKKRYPSAIVATAVVPWDEKFEFMEDLFRKQVRAMRKDLTKHIYIFGTAGEGYAVNNPQFKHIARVFREETGRSPGEFIASARLQAACRLLEDSQFPLKAVAQRSGLRSPATLRRVFASRLGVSPLSYRDKFRTAEAAAIPA